MARSLRASDAHRICFNPPSSDTSHPASTRAWFPVANLLYSSSFGRPPLLVGVVTVVRPSDGPSLLVAVLEVRCQGIRGPFRILWPACRSPSHMSALSVGASRPQSVSRRFSAVPASMATGAPTP